MWRGRGGGIPARKPPERRAAGRKPGLWAAPAVTRAAAECSEGVGVTVSRAALSPAKNSAIFHCAMLADSGNRVSCPGRASARAGTPWDALRGRRNYSLVFRCGSFSRMKASISGAAAIWGWPGIAALLRPQLFVYRDLWLWIDAPFQPPPLLTTVAEQIPLFPAVHLDSRSSNLAPETQQSA